MNPVFKPVNQYCKGDLIYLMWNSVLMGTPIPRAGVYVIENVAPGEIHILDTHIRKYSISDGYRVTGRDHKDFANTPRIPLTLKDWEIAHETFRYVWCVDNLCELHHEITEEMNQIYQCYMSEGKRIELDDYESLIYKLRNILKLVRAL